MRSQRLYENIRPEQFVVSHRNRHTSLALRLTIKLRLASIWIDSDDADLHSAYPPIEDTFEADISHRSMKSFLTRQSSSSAKHRANRVHQIAA
jgi:hypothetical protein